MRASYMKKKHVKLNESEFPLYNDYFLPLNGVFTVSLPSRR